MAGRARFGCVALKSGVKETSTGLTRCATAAPSTGRFSVTGCCIVRPSSVLLHSLAGWSTGTQDRSRPLRPPARSSLLQDGASRALTGAPASPVPRTNMNIARGFHSTRPVAKRDFYEVLGVPKGADKSEIKRKYFQLAKKYHPDQNQDNADAKKKFQEVTEAYEVLGNDDKRAQYDRFGHAGVDANGAGGPGGDPFEAFRQGFGGGGGFQGFQGFQGTMDAEDAQDLFEQLFGRGTRGGQRRRPRGPRRGQDLQLNMQLSFLEAAFGVRKDVDVSYGVVRDGKRVAKTRSVTVEVPAGVESGLAMHMPGEGAEGDPGAPRGDLYVSLNVQADPYFERSGADVHVVATISLVQATLGSKVDVLTIDGMVEVTVPKGSQPDGMLLLRGRGLPRLTGSGTQAGRGDQIVRLKIQVPTKLSNRQRQLLEELREEEDRLAGRSSRQASGSKNGAGSKDHDGREYSERHGTWGEYLHEAFDRLKSHLARKTSTSSSSAGSS